VEPVAPVDALARPALVLIDHDNLGGAPAERDRPLDELQYDYPGPPESQLVKSLEGHPGVDWIRDIYRRHRGSSMEIAR
jgi:hypothetical protein